MSSTPSRSELPRQYIQNDTSYRETSFGGYTNRGTHLHVSEGTINYVQHPLKTNNQHDPLQPLQNLREHCSPRVTFDAAERFDPPRCSDSTRIEIIRRIEQWINDDRSNTVPASLFWLYGGAGVGKSAIAQTLAEKLHQEKNLAASFFFFRTDALRNNGDTLIPTLVSQLVTTFKGLGPFVEENIQANPDLFSKQRHTQFQELLVEPLLRLKSSKLLSFLPRPSVKPILGLISKDALRSRPRLIVIDGLDECRDPEVQCNLLRAISNAIPRISYPLRFLITSRPEPHIVRLFNHDAALQNVTFDRYNLSDDPDADMDIRKFLENEFDEIRRSHCLSKYLPPVWPDKDSITSLVERSSGHFIYAATVIRYIQSDQHRPDDRLEVILRLQPPQGQDQPYIQLDALYSLIFRGIESHEKLEKVFLVLGILSVRKFSDMVEWTSYKCSIIEGILGMKAGDVLLLLSPILSLVAVNNDEVRILHKSLLDYLLDSTRCGHLQISFDLSRVHELAASYILQEKIMANNCAISEFANFAYHCRFGYLNDDLKDFLRNLEVPYPQFVMIKRRGLYHFWLAMIAHFFRALSRDDFDSTGQYHQQYAAKWVDYLQSTDPESFPQTTVDSHTESRAKVDTMLKEWKAKEFKPTKLDGTIPVRRAAVIEQEHRVWSAIARYIYATPKSDVISSLVFGVNFIYSYHLTTAEGPDDSKLLFLTMYSRHENVSVKYDPMVHATFNVKEMQNVLELVEKALLSNFYQKYGLMPDGLFSNMP